MSQRHGAKMSGCRFERNRGSEGDLGEGLFHAVLAGRVKQTRELLEQGASPQTTCPCGCGKGLLVAAIVAGSPGLVRALLDRGADPNTTAEDGATPLMESATWDRPEITDLLIAAGAAVDTVAAEGRTALGEAIYHGRANNIARLVEAGAQVDTKSQNDRSALEWASGKGDEALVALLLERGADVEAASLGGRRPLMSAAAGGHAEIVVLLIARGATLEARDARGTTALLHAAARGGEAQAAAARRLIEAGADVDAGDDSNRTPLLEAAGHGDTELVTLLLERGAQQEARADGATPLIQATLSNQEPIVELLAHRFPRLIDWRDRAGRTALAYAAERGSIRLIDLLSRAGATVDRADQRGATPLLLALAKGHLKAAEQLLEMGADLNSHAKGADAIGAAAARGKSALSWLLDREDFERPTPERLAEVLHESAVRGAEESVLFLLELGADPNWCDRSGTSSLEAAVAHGSYDDRYRQPRSAREDPVAATILSLLEAGADPRAGSGASTLLTQALSLRCPEVARALVKAGADVDPDPAPWMTPLTAAVLRGRVVLARMLLARGADPERRGSEGRCALELARESEKPAMRRLFSLPDCPFLTGPS